METSASLGKRKLLTNRELLRKTLSSPFAQLVVQTRPASIKTGAHWSRQSNFRYNY